MDKFGVQLNLEHVRDARKKWAEAQTSFMADVEFVMGRLILEAANNRMSEQQVAKFSGMTVKRIRILMKAAGLDYRRPALMRQAAAEALQENAALLGIEPHEMDLMSPLAYLPAGSELRRLVEKEPEQVTHSHPASASAECDWCKASML